MNLQISHFKSTPISHHNQQRIATVSFVLNGQLFLNGITVIDDMPNLVLYPTQKFMGREVPLFKPVGREFPIALKNEIIKHHKESFDLLWP